MKKRTAFLIYVWKSGELWASELHWMNNEPGEPFIYTGEIRTEYFEFGLKEAIMNVMELAMDMGIQIKEDLFILYHENFLKQYDNEVNKFPPPENHKEILLKMREEVLAEIKNKVKG